jgi:hypothetical protein
MLAQGYSLDEARKNLYEVIEIQFEEMKELGTLNQSIIHLLDSSFRWNDNTCVLSPMKKYVNTKQEKENTNPFGKQNPTGL